MRQNGVVSSDKALAKPTRRGSFEAISLRWLELRFIGDPNKHSMFYSTSRQTNNFSLQCESNVYLFENPVTSDQI